MSRQYQKQNKKWGKFKKQTKKEKSTPSPTIKILSESSCPIPKILKSCIQSSSIPPYRKSTMDQAVTISIVETSSAEKEIPLW